MTHLAKPFTPDRRGDRLEDWNWEHVGQERLLLLRGSDETAHHVCNGFPGAVRVDLYPKHRPRWTHRLRLQAGDDATELLSLLQRVMVLRVPAELDAVIALDLYSRPCARGTNGLAHTSVGELIHTIKYENRSSAKVRTAGRTLSSSLTEVVLAHPWFQTCDLILPVPGHDQTRLAASDRIGATIAKSTEIDQGSVATRREFRRSVKNMSRSERALLMDEYSIDQDLTGHKVVVVDDVYQTGSTMRGVARAARRAGASTVLGLVGARTLSW
ncbi:ComF family protein [Amycolatopsis sp. cmx-8-4]|uniref:ComF family protein n=1 Tax=Amycolatopsis sp. cmx-8-4 TaxID=2790947 RepID=UPI00397AA29E